MTEEMLNKKRSRIDELFSLENCYSSELSNMRSEKSEVFSIVDDINYVWAGGDDFDEENNKKDESEEDIRNVKFEKKCKSAKQGKKYFLKFKRKLERLKLKNEPRTYTYLKCDEDIKADQFTLKLKNINDKFSINIHDETDKLVSNRWVPKMNKFIADVNLHITKYLKISNNQKLRYLYTEPNILAKIKIWENDKMIFKLKEYIAIARDSDNAYLFVGKELLKIEDNSIDFFILKCDDDYINAHFWRSAESVEEKIEMLNDEESNNMLNELKMKIKDFLIENKEKKILYDEFNKKMNLLTRGEAKVAETIEKFRAEIDKQMSEMISDIELETLRESAKNNEKIKKQLEEEISVAQRYDLEEMDNKIEKRDLDILTMTEDLHKYQKNNLITNEEDSQNECIVCLNHCPEIIFNDCGHFICCRKCYSKMKNKKKIKDDIKCPLCKTVINKTFKAKFY